MSLVPPIRGVIDRRVLVNFRIDPGALSELLPAQFRPRTVETPSGSYAIGGICCIRLRGMRPRGLPAVCGVTSENAAHRIGVTWDEDGGTRAGVFVPRRDTSSRLNSLVGSRAFGRHYHADFDVAEGDGRYEVRMRNDRHDVSMGVRGQVADALPADSVFESVGAASAYHECGSVGYCPSPNGDRLEGVELATDEWRVTPLSVEDVHASYFEDELPASAVTFDNALLMRDVGHEWRPQPSMQGSTHA
ncbi:hypothetical protein G9C85_08130 [Halorubellus sp. JP-L1]|uniref:DUF2071 domain-containing protein n=1 Tax=Halorubellus sp. JP-L1 TaxID=2715753 RepID=UPI00140AA81A|nr:DUF2071 domain-containing protein [Halorubellus sp. JP-L1]NHN41604.1 hypothetical protein [Halorubellus sp. JP-L1]